MPLLTLICSNKIYVVSIRLEKDIIGDDGEVKTIERLIVNLDKDIKMDYFKSPSETPDSNVVLPDFMRKYLSNDLVFSVKLITTIEGGLFQKGGQLEILQKFIFTAYKVDPPHEPTGAQRAVRIFPLTTIRFVGKDTGCFDRCFIEYNLNHRLDSKRIIPGFKKTNHSRRPSLDLENPIILNLTDIIYSGDSAGVFADHDEFKFSVSPEKAAFIKSEKPVVRPLYGRGVYNDRNVDWDNIHFWRENTIHFPNR